MKAEQDRKDELAKIEREKQAKIAAEREALRKKKEAQDAVKRKARLKEEAKKREAFKQKRAERKKGKAKARLVKELKKFINAKNLEDNAYTIKNLVDNNVFEWEIKLYAPEGSLWEYHSFKVTIYFPIDYPKKPPEMKFD